MILSMLLLVTEHGNQTRARRKHNIRIKKRNYFTDVKKNVF